MGVRCKPVATMTANSVMEVGGFHGSIHAILIDRPPFTQHRWRSSDDLPPRGPCPETSTIFGGLNSRG